MKKTLVFLFLILSIPSVKIEGQTPGLKVFFRVQSRESLLLPDVKILLKDLTAGTQSEYYSNDSIMSEFDLSFNKEYEFDFIHPDYYEKSVVIRTDVPRRFMSERYSLEIEITLDRNCENDPEKRKVIYKPIGRIEFNRNKKKFDYDVPYTIRMGERYNERKNERCDLVAEEERMRKKLLKLEAAANENPEKYAELKRMEEQLKAIAILQQKTYEKQKEESLEEIRQEKEALLARAREEEKLKQASKTESELAIYKNKGNKFDETQPQIYIFPRSGWPSELANYILHPETYKPRPIGTFTYDLTKGRSDFYVFDAEELRKKFPEQFQKAFPNWDYIVETNKKFREENK